MLSARPVLRNAVRSAAVAARSSARVVCIIHSMDKKLMVERELLSLGNSNTDSSSIGSLKGSFYAVNA